MWLPHAVPIPICWNRTCSVRPPLPIIPGVNASAHRFGGFGLKHWPDPPPSRGPKPASSPGECQSSGFPARRPSTCCNVARMVVNFGVITPGTALSPEVTYWRHAMLFAAGLTVRQQPCPTPSSTVPVQKPCGRRSTSVKTPTGWRTVRLDRITGACKPPTWSVALTVNTWE